MSKPKKSKNKLAENYNSYALSTPTPSSTSDYAPISRPTYPQRSKFASAYFEKLNDPRWQRKRLEIMQRDGFKCTNCEDETTKLNVHHEYYISLRDPWRYPNAALTTLCEPCHKRLRSFDDDMTPNDPREWELILTCFKPCPNAFDACIEIFEFAEDSGIQVSEVVQMFRQFLRTQKPQP